MRTLLITAGVVTGTALLPAAARAQATRQNPQRIDPVWLTADSGRKTVEFELIAGLTGLNGALNFNGYRDGELVLTVPLGWTVVMHFRNNDAVLPHSAEVIPDMKPVPLGPVQPAFQRAFTIKLEQGLQAGEEDDIRFIGNRPGDFLIFCAVPGHGMAGMWVRLRVSEAARLPSLAAQPVGGS